ncbi:hypothetical protein EVAR_53533_1 [Eumeta japonica]|uniref:Helitron helicase-like domain-containing protein n=1 Tax=Eumeta variegata TaxID=151549 RepID=A0A4C1Y8I1_EUMVA|nr:hypothetical protein EVAR_53533_1 [Eumeta japonica]
MEGSNFKHPNPMGLYKMSDEYQYLSTLAYFNGTEKCISVDPAFESEGYPTWGASHIRDEVRTGSNLVTIVSQTHSPSVHDPHDAPSLDPILKMYNVEIWLLPTLMDNSPEEHEEMSVFIKAECDEKDLTESVVLDPSHMDGTIRNITPIKYNESSAVIKTEYEDEDAGTTQSWNTGLECLHEDSLIDNGSLKKKEYGEIPVFIKTEDLTETAVVNPGRMAGTGNFLPNKYNGTPTMVKTEYEDGNTMQRWDAGFRCLQEDSLIDNGSLKKEASHQRIVRSMDIFNPRGVLTALPASWEGIVYLIEGDRADEKGRGGVDHWNSFSLDEIQQQKLLLHIRTLMKETPMLIKTKYENEDTVTPQKWDKGLEYLQEDFVIDNGPLKNKILDSTSKKLKTSPGGAKRKIQENVKESGRVNFSDDDKIQKRIDDIIKKRKLQNRIRCQRYRNKKKAEAINNSRNPKPSAITVEEEEMIKRRKEKGRQKSQRYRDKKRATNLLNLQTNQSSKAVVEHVCKHQDLHNSQIAGPSTRDVSYFLPTHTAGISTQIKPCIPESHSDYGYETRKNIPLEVQIDHSPQLDESTITNCEPNNRNILPGDVQNNTQDVESQHNFLVPAKVNSQIPKLPTITVEEEEIMKRRKEKDKQKKNLKNIPLDLVTKGLISPRIPFMQIRRLLHVHGRFGIYGQVINIPIEVKTMICTLPRNEDDDHSIMVHIRRRKIHKFGHIYSIINRRNIKAWLQYLKDTPLYTSYGITVDDSFINGQDHVQDEITHDEDGDNDISEQISIDESSIAQQQTLMWNYEMYLRIAPSEGNVPISLLFDEHAEELSFPEIYLGQFRTFRDGVTVTPLMMARSELRRSDRRGVTSQHLLYLAMKIMRIRIRDSLSVAFKHGKDTAITKGQIESENCVNGCYESNLAFLRTIPNSTHYWSEMKKDLFAMIRQYGKPTVFFTISANEIGWPKLLQLLHNLKNNSDISVEDVSALHFIEKSTLVNDDAVTCAIYFNKLVNVLMKILQSKRFSPFQKYRVLYYFKKIEFQHRGSPAAHILAWLGNAPEDALGKDYNKSINLVDFLISVSAAEASGNTELQTHKHTFTCYKEVTSRRMQRCRFEAPFMPIKTTMILTPMKNTEDGFEEYKAKYNALRNKLKNYDYDNFETFYEDNNIKSDREYIDVIRAGINRPRVFPKRQLHEKWHNPFNPFILNIVKSSTDFQFITEEHSCASYVAEYVNKTNRGIGDLQRKIIEVMDEHPEFNIFEIAKNNGINLLNNTEMTSQEAAWYLLKEPTSKSSTSIVYIPTVWPIERQRIKKTMKELSGLNNDCTDIWKENWFDKYEKRPEDLEGVSLAQFVSKYYKNDKGKYVKRDDPRIIRYRNYDMATDSDEYKREMVTLHIPFRHEEADILKETKFITLYDENVDLILEKRKEFESNIDVEKMLQICREIYREEIPDDDEDVNGSKRCCRGRSSGARRRGGALRVTVDRQVSSRKLLTPGTGGVHKGPVTRALIKDAVFKSLTEMGYECPENEIDKVCAHRDSRIEPRDHSCLELKLEQI